MMPGFAITVPHAAPPLSPSIPPSMWSQSRALHLRWDVSARSAARESTTVRIASDGRYIYVRFDASQREPIEASAHSDDVGKGNDDAVWVDLWPDGTRGFRYKFEATPNGTHYESSSENTSFAPIWSSYGTSGTHGYTTTLKIPIDILRGAHAGIWHAQFVRYIHATGAEYIWSHYPTQGTPDDVAGSGEIVIPRLSPDIAARSRARAAVYALAVAAPAANGGSTSRIGADISVPVTPTASLYATVHPDFSNVELDQQSISPSVYQRVYSEVRPFFTQGASLYDHQWYWVSNAPISQLYTPAIPTPSDGYAIEGKQGLFSVGGFYVHGGRRSDQADVVDYASPDMRLQMSAQRVQSASPGLLDTATNVALQYNSLDHLKSYFTYGDDTGTNVRAGNQAQWYDAGAAWTSKTFGLYGAFRKVGAYYDPVDGFVYHPDIAGYGIYAAKIFDFSPSSRLLSAGIQIQIDRFQGHALGSSQSDNQLTIDLLTRSALDVQVSSGSDYWRFGNMLTPVSQSAGFGLTYHSGLQTDNPSQFPYHGSSATPTSIAYSTGAYGGGRLDSWTRSSTLRLGSRGSVTLTADDTKQRIPDAAERIQWFESVGYAEQLNAETSIAVGARRIVGVPPIPNGGGNCTTVCSNLSLAFHYRMRRSELYAAYGDPNALSSVPQAIVKLIFYEGADKGA